MGSNRAVAELLAGYRPSDPAESGDVARLAAVLAEEDDPWSQRIPLHLTASAVVVHPATGQVLLRWHARQQAWLQIGGHGDPGEVDPVLVALREGAEETGLGDLVPWPTADLVHVVIVSVAAKGDGTGPGAARHEHADLRFVLATRSPEQSRPERPDAELRWLGVHEACELTSEANLRETLRRVAVLLRANATAEPHG